MVKRRSIFLYPFSLIYGLVTSVRNFLYNAEILKSYEPDIPVLCVGNLSAGGSGKTPHAEYLIKILKDYFNVALLSRGYKRKSRGFRFAEPGSSVADMGDEPLQIYTKFPGITVAVDRDRVNGIQRIMKERPGTEVIILDDGFQHRRVRPGLSILLTGFDNLVINDALLPYGNLRESLSNISRADIILVTKSPENITPIQRNVIAKDLKKAAYQEVWFTAINYMHPLPVFDTGPGAGNPVLSGGSDSGVVLVTGIANPDPLVAYLKNIFIEVIHLSFGDHHRFTDKDIEKIFTAWGSLKRENRYAVTTEKDAVRLKEFTNIAETLKSSFFYIPIGIRFLNGDRNGFDNLIIDYVRKNKRNNRIS